MSDLDSFLDWVGSGLKDAEIALHNGDAGPRRAIWSQHDPVTVLGAWKSRGPCRVCLCGPGRAGAEECCR